MKAMNLKGIQYVEMVLGVKEIIMDDPSPPNEEQLQILAKIGLILDHGSPKMEENREIHNAFLEAIHWELRWRTRFVRFNDGEPVKLLLREGAAWRWGRLYELVSLANPEMQTLLRQADQRAAG